MATSRKRIFRYFGILVVLALSYLVYANYPRLNIIAGYSAKNMSSSVFIANRSMGFTDENDNGFTPVNLASDKVDLDEKSATASVYGLLTRKAVYREGLGSVLTVGDYDTEKPLLVPKRSNNPKSLPFPYGNLPQMDTLFQNIDYGQLSRTVDSAFANPTVKKTRGIIVMYKDQILAEKYAPGFDQNSVILGWSMTKSITSTLFGILQKQGKLNIKDKTGIAAWQNDERVNITINDLLHMNSGLAWEENYESISDATRMLFLAKDMSVVQEEKQPIAEPNTRWNYSSGTSNLLSGLLRDQFESHQAYLDFWYTELIDKIGMHSMLIETDLAGNYVGSSYGWATTRDWAKFGLLYLHRGNWNGEQIIDPSWVDYVKEPTATSNGEYGGHFWLNAGGKYPDAPRDIFSANGYQGQRVFIIPSKEMVIVRMGLAGESGFDFNLFLKEVIASVN